MVCCLSPGWTFFHTETDESFQSKDDFKFFFLDLAVSLLCLSECLWCVLVIGCSILFVKRWNNTTPISPSEASQDISFYCEWLQCTRTVSPHSASFSCWNSHCLPTPHLHGLFFPVSWLKALPVWIGLETIFHRTAQIQGMSRLLYHLMEGSSWG